MNPTQEIQQRNKHVCSVTRFGSFTYASHMHYVNHLFCTNSPYVDFPLPVPMQWLWPTTLHCTCILCIVHAYCTLYMHTVHCTCILCIVHAYCALYMHTVCAAAPLSRIMFLTTINNCSTNLSIDHRLVTTNRLVHTTNLLMHTAP